MSSKNWESFSVYGVGVTSCIGIWTCTMDCWMDCKGSGVYGFVAVDYCACFVHHDEVWDSDKGKVAGEWVQPCKFVSIRICYFGLKGGILYRSGLLELDLSHLIARMVSSILYLGRSYLLIWPATPSSKPRSAKILNAAARCCFLYNRSSSKLSNRGYVLIFSVLPEAVRPSAPSLTLCPVSCLRAVAVGGANLLVLVHKRRWTGLVVDLTKLLEKTFAWLPDNRMWQRYIFRKLAWEV